MILSFKLPPRVFEFFHFVFTSFVRKFGFPKRHFDLVSVGCFLVACKVA